MGSSVPAALGAAVAAPDRPAVAVVGDGGLLMCAQTIHAAAAAELPVVVVALNNDDYGTISWAAARDHGFEPGAFGWGDSPVAAADLAESLGARGRRAETPAAVTAAVETALAADGPTLIEVPTDPDEPQAKPLS
jgi:acetolactate synthase-1/2/3 large subunit